MIIPFRKISIGRPATSGATRFDVLKGRIRELAGAVANRLGMPGVIRNADISDSVTGQKLTVQVSPWFVRLSVDGRDYYFDRLTGTFDGAGAAVTQPSDSRSGSVQR